MAEPKREKIIKIRVSAEEHELLKHISHRSELARWMRETCLNPTGDLVAASRGTVTKAPPELIRGLAGIGNNLNQIARAVNRQAWGPSDRVQILAALGGIEAELEALRDR